MLKKYSIEIVNIILSIVFPSVFIGIFFFTYGKTVEKECVVNNVNFLIDDVISPVKTLISPEQKAILLQQLDNIELANMDEEDKKVEKINNALLKKSFIVLSGLFLVGIIISYILYRYSNKEVSFSVIIARNVIILLLGIALIELLFAAFIPAQFVSADPNLLKKRSFEIIKQELNKH